MEWQPIETAPRDGTWVQLAGGSIDYGWVGDGSPSSVAGQFTHVRNGTTHEDGWWQFAWYDGGYYGQYVDPTHWMPLPTPPKLDP